MSVHPGGLGVAAYGLAPPTDRLHRLEAWLGGCHRHPRGHVQSCCTALGLLIRASIWPVPVLLPAAPRLLPSGASPATYKHPMLTANVLLLRRLLLLLLRLLLLGRSGCHA